MEILKPKAFLIAHHRFLKWPLVLMVLISGVLSLTAVIFAYFSKQLLDAAIEGIQSQFILAGIIVVLVMVIQLSFNAVQRYIQLFYTSKVDRHLKDLLYKDLLKKDHRVLESYHSGRLMNLLTSDVEKISEGLIEVIPRFVFLVLRFFFAFALLIYLDWLLAVIMLGVGVLLFFSSLFLRSPIKKRHHTMQDEEASLRAYMQENIENVPVIKSFEAEDFTMNQVNQRQGKYFDARLKKGRLSIFASTGLNAFFGFGYVFALIFGAFRIVEGAITFGSLIAILQLVNQMQMPFSGLSTLFPKYYATLASTERLMQVMEQASEVKEEGLVKNTSFESLVFNQVSFAYDQDNVIEDFTAKIKAGSFVHIVGKSGIGKTTLFKLLLGLVYPHQGSIHLVTDKERIEISPNTRKYFTYVPQNHMIFSGTIKENLMYNQTNLSEDDLVRVTKMCGLYEDIKTLPNQFESVLGERGIGFSEGQKQRLAIARALLKEAPILLLDEITSALDENTEAWIINQIKTLSDKTCLIISHRPLNENDIDNKISL